MNEQVGNEINREDIIMALKCRLNIDDSRWKNCYRCKYAEILPWDVTNCHYDGLFRDCLKLLDTREVETK